MKPATTTLPLLLLLSALLLAWSATAQTPPTQTCVSKLIDCTNDLNATKPSDKCCASLKEAVTNDLPCLCGLLQNTALINNFGINLTQALELPKRCGITSDTSVCKTAGTPAAPASPAGTPASGGAPSSPSGTPATPKGNSSAASANSVSWAVMYVLTSSLFVWWSMA